MKSIALEKYIMFACYALNPSDIINVKVCDDNCFSSTPKRLNQNRSNLLC